MEEYRQGVLRVYYDAVCSGCRRDRSRYERWAGEAGEEVAWCDVTEHQQLLRDKGVEPQAALLSLHVEEEDGRIVEGIDAYILLMRREIGRASCRERVQVW